MIGTAENHQVESIKQNNTYYHDFEQFPGTKRVRVALGLA
jgi:hypothetical protein